jgi:hypothetical protein
LWWLQRKYGAMWKQLPLTRGQSGRRRLCSTAPRRRCWL